MKRFPLLFLLLALLALTAASVHALPADIAEDGAVAGQVAQQPEELFLSEYIEGSSLNKALEIYNGTGSAVDLAAGNYVIEFYFNGSTSVGGTIPLSGVVADGEVWVVADDGADPAILAETDQTSTISFFNGDDVIILRKDGAIIDVFGQLGVDPGAEWGTGDQSGADNTLRRMAEVCAGDTNPDDAFDPATEWDGFPNNTFDGLGSHSPDCDGGPGTPNVTINEIRTDQTGADNDEYFELAGPAGASLDGLTYLVIGDGAAAAGSGVIEVVVPLDGQAISVGGFFVAAEATFSMGTADLVTNLNFENSDNVTHLLVSNFSGADGDDLDTDDDGVLDVTPWDEVVDLIALILQENPPTSTEYHYGPPTVGPDGEFVPGHAFLCDEGWQVGAFGGGQDTPGEENNCGGNGGEQCGDPVTFIHEIQGSGNSSPLVGQNVSLEGIVVGDFQNNASPDDGDLNGFYVQEEAADQDDNPLTSEGIFVFAPAADDVAPGDHVRVSGTVVEFDGLTEISPASDVQVCAAGELPEPVDVFLPMTSPDDFERYEGMLVRLPQQLVITEYFNFDRFNEIVISLPATGPDRPSQPTAVAEPGSPEAEAIALQNALSRITVDDGRTTQNPDPALHPNGEVFDLDNLFRGGDLLENTTGILDHRFALYRIQPTTGATHIPTNPRPAAPEPVGGSLTVASFNVLNYFLTLDLGPDICGPLQNMECRGADTPEEFERQRAKILAALSEIGADVFGLMEMENTTGVEPLQDIVDGLNDIFGPGTYDFIDTGTIGGDAIRNGFIYNTTTVSPLGDYEILDSSDDPRFLDFLNRPVLAQSFTEIATGEVFTVAVNHLKSKGSACDDVGDPDIGDGQGNCNLTRKEAAEALVDWLVEDPTGSGDPDYLIIGDLNSYDKEDPIDAIREGADDILGTEDDYTDLLFHFIGEYAYGYVFDGTWGYLDHALANQALLAQVSGTTVWHINADEADLIDYDMSFKQDAQDQLYEPNAYRSSDHDPVIVGLALSSDGGCNDTEPPMVEVITNPSQLWPADHSYVDVMATVNVWDEDPNPTVTLLSVTSNEPDSGTGRGDLPNDIVIVDDTHFQLRAERTASGDGRVYTITYEVTDACGNTTIASATVTVPIRPIRPPVFHVTSQFD